MRYFDWPARLDSFLAARAAQPFAWGAVDCCLFVADAVLAISEIDIAAPYRERYSSAREAARIIRPHGGLSNLITEEMELNGFPAIPAAFAQRGDVVSLRRGSGARLGIVSLNGKQIVAAGESGIVRLHMNFAESAWRI